MTPEILVERLRNNAERPEAALVRELLRKEREERDDNHEDQS